MIVNQLSQFATQIAPFAITGVIVSAIVQYGKKFLAKTGHKVALLCAASVLVGGVAYFIKAIPQTFLTDIIGVLASANAFYVLFIQWFEAPSESSSQPLA